MNDYRYPETSIVRAVGRREGSGANRDDVKNLKLTADSIVVDKYHWSGLAAGVNQMRVAAMAARMGGHVRVGLKDSLWIGAGQLASSNAEQVTKVRQIIEGLGKQVAAPDEARDILQLKGGDKVAF